MGVADADDPVAEIEAREEVAARARELKDATGWGPTMRVAPVARAWADLAREMEAGDAATVRELDRETIERLAQPLWIAPEL